MNRDTFQILLRILAFPATLVMAMENFVRALILKSNIKQGVIACPHCRQANDLLVLGECSCGRVEYGHRLECTGCGARARDFRCDHCGVTVDVW